MNAPKLGPGVLYTMTSHNAEAVNKRRVDYDHHRRIAGDAANTGHVGHTGNAVAEGDVYPATVVRVWNPESSTVNLKVHLDGNDDFWATSAVHGEGPGHWSYPTKD